MLVDMTSDGGDFRHVNHVHVFYNKGGMLRRGELMTKEIHVADMTSSPEERAAAAEKRRAAMQGDQSHRLHPRLAERPNGQQRGGEPAETGGPMDRYLSFPSEVRAETVERDGKQFFKVEGYATVFGRSYEMWDVFGPYEEKVREGAADQTLAAKPDVVFLLNHRGLSMARTGGPWNGNSSTLDLTADATGLKDVAWLNPARSEVKDLTLAIDDKVVTEQSFAFMIDEGLWNEDFTEFEIVRFDLNRGDVSAVNYGANPFTSIAARQQEILTDLRLAGPSMARAALHSLLQRTDIDVDSEVDRIDQERQAPEPTGRSITQIEAMLQD